MSRNAELKKLREVFTWVGGMFLGLGNAPIISMGTWCPLSPHPSLLLIFVCVAVTFIVVGIYAPEYITLSRVFSTVSLLNLMRNVFVALPTLFQQISQILVRYDSTHFFSFPTGRLTRHRSLTDLCRLGLYRTHSGVPRCG